MVATVAHIACNAFVGSLLRGSEVMTLEEMNFLYFGGLNNVLAVQIQTQDALEAAMAADDKDKLQQALQSDQAQVCKQTLQT